MVRYRCILRYGTHAFYDTDVFYGTIPVYFKSKANISKSSFAKHRLWDEGINLGGGTVPFCGEDAGVALALALGLAMVGIGVSG